MTDKEKLIGLIQSAVGGCARHWAELIADHLLANGVTFATDTNVGSKWISVEDRLPDAIDNYIVAVKYKYDHEEEYSYGTDVAVYNPYESADIDGCWNTFNDWYEGQQFLHVTHWMPLPMPLPPDPPEEKTP